LKLSRLAIHITSASTALFLSYSIIFTANMLEIPFYLGYRKFIVNITLLTPSLDRILWASSILVSSTLLAAVHRGSGNRNWRNLSVLLYGFTLAALVYVSLSGFEAMSVLALTVSGLAFTAVSALHKREAFGGRRLPLLLIASYIILILLAIEVTSLTRWVYHLYSPSLVFSDSSWSIAFAEAQISSMLYPALPGILIFFSFSWVGELIFRGLLMKSTDVEAKNNSDMMLRGSNLFKVLASTAVFAALFMGFYNFSIAGKFNPAFSGTDIPYYVRDLNGMLGSSPFEALSLATKDDRFLYLVLQYICFWFSGMPSQTFVTFAVPVVLTSLLMLATFVLVKIGGSKLQASTVPIVTALSFQVTVGLYGGFFANWFALTVTYVFYGFLTRAPE